MSFFETYRSALHPRADFKAIFVRPSARYASLDGARGLTILLMILFHVLFGIVRLLQESGGIDAFVQSFPGWLNWIWHAQGSDPLFVMCGLLVSYSLFKEHDQHGRLDIGTFYYRRAGRIVPLFLVALILYMPTDNDNYRHLLSNLFFASNFFDGERTIIPVGWSLDLQVQFYLLLPLFYVYAFYRTRHKIALLVALLAAATLWRMWVLYQEPSLFQRPFFEAYSDRQLARLLADTLYYDLDMRIGGFIMGMLVAALHQYHGARIERFLRAHPLFNLGLLATALWLIYVSVSVPYHNPHAEFYQHFDPISNFLFLSLAKYGYCAGIALLVLLVLIPVGPSHLVNRVFGSRLLYPFAQLIFPLYLFHFPFMILAAVCVFMTTDKHAIVGVQIWQVFATYALTVLFTAAFSALLHVYIEKPLIRLADRGRGEPRHVPLEKEAVI